MADQFPEGGQGSELGPFREGIPGSECGACSSEEQEGSYCSWDRCREVEP